MQISSFSLISSLNFNYYDHLWILVMWSEPRILIAKCPSLVVSIMQRFQLFVHIHLLLLSCVSAVFRSSLSTYAPIPTVQSMPPPCLLLWWSKSSLPWSALWERMAQRLVSDIILRRTCRVLFLTQIHVPLFETPVVSCSSTDLLVAAIPKRRQTTMSV